MNKKIIVVLSALVSIAVQAETAAPTFTPERFRGHVEFLADDLLEGRETGTRGYDIAARYVASQFESVGLKPGGENGSWYQQVTLQRTARGADRGGLTISGPAGEQRFAHADNVMVWLNSREAAFDVSAPLVFVGFGVEDKRLGVDDYRGLNVKGRIVVLLRGFPKGLPSEEGAHLSAEKAKVAERHGAIGLLTLSTLQSQKVIPWNRMLEYADEPEFAWVGADGKAHEEAPGIRARAALNDPAAEALFAGSARTLADIRLEADKTRGMPRGFALKTRVRLQSTSSWTRVTSPNVIGILPGADASLAREYIVLSAHLDHLGIKGVGNSAGSSAGDRIYNGALDNAAGIAALLEAARAAATAPDKPRRSIMFLATTAEEKGLLGADYYARHPTVPLAQIVGNVDLDMPMLLYPFTDLIAFGANHSTIGRQVADAVAPMNIKLSPDPMPEQGVFTRSDHYQFVRQGVPALMLATGMENGGGEAWGKFLEGAYHNPGDDLSQPINWQAGARFAEVNYRITRAMADAEARPLWYAGDYFGDTFAPKAARAAR
ncbi:MAG TPA: M28 family metallopeptidase [Steroidobacteraceae bacterium]|nr:M28 family metallopeptidase [Steroidobacteraceae bacterium]